MNYPRQSERIELVLKINEISQPAVLIEVQKELIVVPIYTKAEQLQGTIQSISVQKFYKT